MPARVEHQGRLHRGARWHARRGLPGSPPCTSLSYSEPVRATLPLSELRERLHTLPDRSGSGAVPHLLLLAHVGILPFPQRAARARPTPTTRPYRLDARARPPHLRRARDRGRAATVRCCSRPTSAIPRSPTTTCPGIAVATMLAEAADGAQAPHTYRFLFAPGTIGPLCWLNQNLDRLDRIQHGLALVVHRRRGQPDLQAQPALEGRSTVAMETVLRDSGAAASRAPVGAVGRG